MIPIRDSIESRQIPFVNYFLILACTLVFLAQISSDDGGQRIVQAYGMVPLRLTDPSATPMIAHRVAVQTPFGTVLQDTRQPVAPAAVSPWATLLTCMFLHGGWMHFLGNMWFLYIFGDNVEDRFGHGGYLAMYLGTGLAAGISHLVTNAASPIPTIGASGAIAGVMGAYALLYPHARVMAVLPIVVILQTFVVPAPVFLGVWFVMQMLNGLSASEMSTGVAWWAHIGGFVAGAAIAVAVRGSGYGRVEATANNGQHRF